MDRSEMDKAWGKIIAQAWSDPEFKKELLENPKEVLSSHGIELPSGEIEVVENTEKKHYLILPKHPSGEHTIEELENMSAGTDTAFSGSCHFVDV